MLRRGKSRHSRYPTLMPGPTSPAFLGRVCQEFDRRLWASLNYKTRASPWLVHLVALAARKGNCRTVWREKESSGPRRPGRNGRLPRESHRPLSLASPARRGLGMRGQSPKRLREGRGIAKAGATVFRRDAVAAGRRRTARAIHWTTPARRRCGTHQRQPMPLAV